MAETVQSVERAFAILETFDEQHPSRTAADIAEAAGLARPTTYRMLQTLRQLGYVRHVNGRFEVTPRVLRLGAGYLGRESLAARAQPALDRLSEQCGEHVAIGMLDGDEVITLAASSSPQSRLLAIAIQPGQRLPADRTSLGQVLLALPLRRRRRTAPTRSASQGYALVDGQLETGLRSLGVPDPRPPRHGHRGARRRRQRRPHHHRAARGRLPAGAPLRPPTRSPSSSDRNRQEATHVEDRSPVPGRPRRQPAAHARHPRRARPSSAPAGSMTPACATSRTARSPR